MSYMQEAMIYQTTCWHLYMRRVKIKMAIC